MAETMAMPAMEAEAPEPRMQLVEAMDTLDEFHIKRADMQRVYSALETILEPNESEDEAQPMAADEAVAKEMFATGRDRKAV